MSTGLKNLTFDEWLKFVFDHPVEEMKQAWYWDVDADWWDGSPPCNDISALTRVR